MLAALLPEMRPVQTGRIFLRALQRRTPPCWELRKLGIMADCNDGDKTQRFLSTSSDIAGSLAGTALGALGGVPGSIAGAIVGPVVGDFAFRMLSQREKARVVGVLDVAAAHMEKKQRLGYEPRADDFLIGSPGNRPFAEEVAEGVLLAAQREHEERKIRYLGYLLANFVFEEEIDRRQANYLVRLLSQLSWTQVRLLAIFHQNDIEGLRSVDYAGDAGYGVGWNVWVLLSEVQELWIPNLVALEGGNRLAGGIPSASFVVPSMMAPRGFGELLVQLAELASIDRADLDEVANLLR